MLGAAAKRSETELALIYTRSLCRRAVAQGGCANACVSFFVARWGGCKWSETELARRSLAVPLGGCASACVIFFWAGGCKLLETELARIYVRSLCPWAVAPTLA